MQAAPADDRRAALYTTLHAAGIACDATPLTRGLYAHDASNYRITPQLVVFPRSVEDVQRTVRACAELSVPVTARGAGTGMAGNSIGTGAVLDFRRFMHREITIDPQTRSAWVQPGVVLDDLQVAAAAHGLMFGPDPSSHSRATIGGMLGNDACGNHSVAYGRTSDHVLELDLVLADGTRARATRGGIAAVDATEAHRIETLVSHLHGIRDGFTSTLRAEFDRCPRQVSGLAVHRLLAEHGFDVARSLVGSEGTLAIVVGARLALVPRPTKHELLIIGYPDLIAAARDVPALLEYRPAAIEAVDTAIVATLRARRGDAAVPAMPAGEAWLFVEFADTIEHADPGLAAARILAQGRAVSAIAVSEPAQRTALWRVREEGAGLASNLLDGTRGRPGWEDAAVPPARLAEYLDGLRALQERHGFRGVLYGHFGAGCVHVRFDFDTDTDAGRARMRHFVQAAARLVARCGGSVSGEHGDGRARSELLPLMYSSAALEAFAQMKRAFDPDDLLNPRVIVDPPPLDRDMPTPHASHGTTLLLGEDGRDLARAAARCVGIGKCVATGVQAMCPTFAISGEERDSTRGRARAIQDLFNHSGLTRAETLATLDSCLSCKACATECPTGVDITTYKAELLHEHFRGRLRPRTHYALGWLPQLVAPLAPLAPLINALTSRRGPRRLVAALLGLSTQRRLPALATRRAQAAMHRLTPAPEPRAILFVDALTRAFAPHVVVAATRVLADAGVPVLPLLHGDAGLTWITTGQLGTARAVQRNLLQRLSALPGDLPIIVLEPSAAACLADDLPRLLDTDEARAIAPRIRTFAAALVELAPDWAPTTLPPRIVLQPHCHERAVFTGTSQAQWLRRLGVEVTEPIGCCGMGGNFGFEPGHEAMSIGVAERSLLPTIDAAPTAVLLADGLGCRCQIDDLRPTAAPLHLAELLDRLR